MARIAYILGRFPVMSETFIGNEIRAVEALGHEIFPIALHRPDAEFQPEDASLAARTLYFSAINPQTSKTLIRQHLLKFYRIIYFVLSQTTEPYYPLMIHAAYLANYMEEHKCTHVHAHFGWGAATYAIAAARLLGLPVTFTCHGSDVYARPLDLKLKCHAASAVIAVSPTLAKDLQAVAGRTPVHTVFCGVDVNRFKPAEKSQKHDRWLFVGRLIDCKGINDILAAWALLPQDQRPNLDIVGDGNLRNSLEVYAREHAIEEHVTFLGAKPASWIVENGPLYRAFISAFKQGGDGSRDTAPMALKEAMALGLPIVTTDFMDIPSIVTNNCAITCPTASADALAKAIVYVQNLPKEALDNMESAARKGAEHYSLRQQAETLTKLFALYAK